MLEIFDHMLLELAERNREGVVIRRLVVDTIEVDDLIVALKPASDALRKAFFDALPEKASLSLQEQIEFLMPKSLRAAEAAQERVLGKMKALLRSGEIRLKAKT